MSTFVELAFRPTRRTDHRALTGTLVRETPLDVAIDVSAALLSYLSRGSTDGHHCISLHDATATDAVQILRSE